MGSPSSSARKARRPPWEAAASSSRGRAECAAAIRRRSLASIGLRSTDHVVRLRAALAFLGPTSWTERPLCALTGLAVDQVESALASLMASGALIEIPIGPRRTVRVLAESVAELEERALRALGRLHEAHPRQSAIPRAQLVSVFPELANEAFVNGLIDRLKARGMVVADPRGRSGWLRAQAEPGGTKTQERAGRVGPGRRDEPPGHGRARGVRRRRGGRSSPSCWRCSATNST